MVATNGRDAAIETPAPDISLAGQRRSRASRSYQAKLAHALGKTREAATDADWYHATALALRDRVINTFLQARNETKRQKKKRVYYLSIEFLLGRLLFDTLTNLQLVEPTRAALRSLGADLDRLREVEPDAALGNGGLGRLAACYLDSMSALGIPAYGYGIRYENGLFEQRISDGWQQEFPGKLARGRQPVGIEPPRPPYSIGFGGTVEYRGGGRNSASVLVSGRARVGGALQTRRSPAGAAATPTCCGLWSARAVTPVHLAAFNRGGLRRCHRGAGAERGDLAFPLSQ